MERGNLKKGSDLYDSRLKTGSDRSLKLQARCKSGRSPGHQPYLKTTTGETIVDNKELAGLKKAQAEAQAALIDTNKKIEEIQKQLGK